jgi:hypothetical protein
MFLSLWLLPGWALGLYFFLPLIANKSATVFGNVPPGYERTPHNSNSFALIRLNARFSRAIDAVATQHNTQRESKSFDVLRCDENKRLPDGTTNSDTGISAGPLVFSGKFRFHFCF